MWGKPISDKITKHLLNYNSDLSKKQNVAIIIDEHD